MPFGCLQLVDVDCLLLRTDLQVYEQLTTTRCVIMHCLQHPVRQYSILNDQVV